MVILFQLSEVHDANVTALFDICTVKQEQLSVPYRHA